MTCGFCRLNEGECEIMLSGTIKDILANEGAASFTTLGPEGQHMAATWNSYIRIIGNSELLIPAGSLYKTEENCKNGSAIQMIVASRSIKGIHGDGAGFLLTGTAEFEDHGPRFEQMKRDFPWCRAAMLLRISEVKQLL